VRTFLEEYVGRDAAVLELGCSAGRHLSELHDHGFSDLTGIEVNAAAFEVMAENYPDLYDAGTFHHAAIEDVVPTFDDGQFDAVYSVETLQHVHPDEAWVFEELVRITADTLVTLEHEGTQDPETSRHGEVNHVSETVPLYYRNWKQVFTAFDVAEVAARAGERDTIRAFRRSAVVAGR